MNPLDAIAARAALNLAGTPAPGRPALRTPRDYLEESLDRRSPNDLKNHLQKVRTDADVAIAKCDKALARPGAAPNYNTNLRRAMSENGINYGASGRIISVQ